MTRRTEERTPPATRHHYLRAKRCLDLIGASVALVLTSPLLAVTALLVLSRLGSPVLFRQRRPGLHGKPFTIYKFRTMRDLSDKAGDPLPDSARLTGLGRFLRKTSIDELPELFNVLRGDMSLVGPRPLLMEYLSRYSDEQSRRHDLPPGITGLAQVNGRNALYFSERISFDLEYVGRASFFLDLKIIALTLIRVLTFDLEDRAGQHVSVVDDLGLHPDSGGQPGPGSAQTRAEQEGCDD